MTNAYDFTFQSLIDGTPLPLAQFQGHPLLVVNTASKCGFTKQYADLEALYQNYRDQGLVIIGVPCNDFGHQEPGSSEDIATFCKVNYGVTFPLTQKERVRGKEAHPFYAWAKTTLGFGTGPKWNFHKYLIDRQGQLIDYFNSATSPEADRVKQAIETCIRQGES